MIFIVTHCKVVYVCVVQTTAFKGFTGFSGFGSGSAGFSFGSGTGTLTGAGSKPSTSIPALTTASVTTASVTTVSVPTCSTVINASSRSAGFSFGFSDTKLAADNGTTHTGTSSAKDDLPAA